jgi:dihydrofolate reductase
MPKTQYYTATSIDGYIADQHNSLDWLFEVGAGDPPDPDVPSHETEFAEFFSDVGAMAMGSTTYEWVIEHEKLLDDPSKWTEWYGQTPTWVFTHRDLPVVQGAALRFVSGDVGPVHQHMSAAADGKNIWLVGGGELVGAFADQGLLDEIILGMAPVTLGAGAPLLPRRITASRLRLTGVRQGGQFAHLTYAVGPHTG